MFSIAIWACKVLSWLVCINKEEQGSHAFSASKMRTFKEKKGHFLAIYKENVARLRQKPIIIKTIYGGFRVNSSSTAS